ncbi:MAG: hypothetical protein M3O22_03070 [Pseudomonadota bacterium]|nr:hypothetical protein [Pseudomonadota bacterium]
MTQTSDRTTLEAGFYLCADGLKYRPEETGKRQTCFGQVEDLIFRFPPAERLDKWHDLIRIGNPACFSHDEEIRMAGLWSRIVSEIQDPQERRSRIENPPGYFSVVLQFRALELAVKEIRMWEKESDKTGLRKFMENVSVSIQDLWKAAAFRNPYADGRTSFGKQADSRVRAFAAFLQAWRRRQVVAVSREADRLDIAVERLRPYVVPSPETALACRGPSV